MRLYNGDCLDILKNIPDNSIDLVVTDPPYVIETKGAGIYKQADKQYVKELAGLKDGFSPNVLDELCRVMKKINCYFFCSQKQIIPLLQYFVGKKSVIITCLAGIRLTLFLLVGINILRTQNLSYFLGKKESEYMASSKQNAHFILLRSIRKIRNYINILHVNQLRYCRI